MKSSLTEKIQRRLGLNNPNTTYDEDLIGDYIEEAVTIINDWARPSSEDCFINGSYNSAIILYVIESLNVNGAEGYSSFSDGNQKNVLKNGPVGNLKSRIPQGL